MYGMCIFNVGYYINTFMYIGYRCSFNSSQVIQRSGYGPKILAPSFLVAKSSPSPSAPLTCIVTVCTQYTHSFYSRLIYRWW